MYDFRTGQNVVGGLVAGRTNRSTETIGARLVALRKLEGLTQEQLARKVGVTRRRIAYYERETQRPPTTILPKLAMVFNVSADTILNIKSPSQRKSKSKTVAYPSPETTQKRVMSVREVYSEREVQIVKGDSRKALEKFPDRTFQSCITSPPYWGLRDYGYDGQIGAESDPADYISDLVAVFREVRRTLMDDGTLWLNIGDSYTSGNRKWRDADKKNPAREMAYRPPTPKGLKPKDLIGIPWRLALALQEDGWFLRSDIIWNKPNCQPESVKDRPTRSHEYIFLLSKSKKYFYNFEAIKEPSNNNGRSKNRRTVWDINTNGFSGAHFAVFPPELVRVCLRAGSRKNSVVLDPFFGSGTVGLVCMAEKRRCVGIELHPKYVDLAIGRVNTIQPKLAL